MNPYLKQYKQTQINTTPKEQILLMLYDGAVRFLKQAKEGFAENNIEKIHNNIIKTQNILTELQSSLDMQGGGDFAKNLSSLYEYLINRLFQANMKKREDFVDEALKHIEQLRDTWREAVKNFKAQGGTLLDNQVDRYNTSSFDTDDSEDEDDEEDIGEYVI